MLFQISVIYSRAGCGSLGSSGTGAIIQDFRILGHQTNRWNLPQSIHLIFWCTVFPLILGHESRYPDHLKVPLVDSGLTELVFSREKITLLWKLIKVIFYDQYLPPSTVLTLSIWLPLKLIAPLSVWNVTARTCTLYSVCALSRSTSKYVCAVSLANATIGPASWLVGVHTTA